MDQFEHNFQRLLDNYWVGSISAQSLPGRTWPASSPLPWSLSPPWSLLLLGHVIPFWKAFDEANQNVIAGLGF